MRNNSPVKRDASEHGTRSRFTPLAVAGLRLEARDEQLLLDLLFHSVMSRSQIQELYFGSVPRCNARLRQLFDHGLVTRYFLPAAPFGAQALYSLGKSAVPLLGNLVEKNPALQLELAELRKLYRRGKTPTFIEHTLAVTDLRLAFRAALDGASDLVLERWVPEPLCRHEYQIRAGGGGYWRGEVFKPDGFIRLTRPSSGAYYNYFIECDRGHTSSKQFLGKLLTHQRYLESGLFRETFGCDEFKTLIVTTTAARVKNLLRLVETQGSSLFWFATFADIRQSGAVGPIWYVPGANCRESLCQ